MVESQQCNGVTSLKIKEENTITNNNEDDPSKMHFSERESDAPFLYFTVLTAILLMLAGSTTLVWASPALIKLKSNDTDINPLGRPIQTIEISMLIGLPALTSILSATLLSKLADIVGRKMTLQLFGVVLLLSRVGTAFSDRITLFVIFNCITNSIQSGIWCVLPIYITEICEDHNRAKFGCLMTLSMPIGQLFTYLVGPAFTIRYFTLINAIPLVPFLLLFLVAPESPVYSLTQGNPEECLKALKKLRTNKTNTEIEEDFKKINFCLQEQTQEHTFRIITIFKTKEGRIGLFLAMLPMFVQFLSGITIVMSLVAPIFDDIGSISGNTIGIVVGSLKVFTYFFTSLIIEKTGRKPLLIISSIGTGLSISTVGFYFYLKYINWSLLDQFTFLPICSVLMYILLYSVGLGSIPLTIMSELFPPNLRPVAIGCVTTTVGIIIFVYTFCYPILAECIGTHWCFWIFGLNSFIGALLICFFMPETKGKSVVEIQEILRNY